MFWLTVQNLEDKENKILHVNFNLYNFFIPDFSSKLLEMQEWLLPFKTVTDLTQDGVAAVVGHLKQYTEDLQKVPRGLITTMRTLRYISIAPENPYSDG